MFLVSGAVGKHWGGGYVGGGDEMGGVGGHFSNVYTSVTRVFDYRESDRPVLFIYLFI